MSFVRALTVFSMIGTAATAQTAKGYIKIGADERHELRFARVAHIQPLLFTKKMFHLVLSEAPLPRLALFDFSYMGVAFLDSNQIVELNFDDKPHPTFGDGVSWSIKRKLPESAIGLGASPNPFPFEINGNVMKGKIESKGDGYEISVTYSAIFEKDPFDVAPISADAIAATNSAAAKVYLEAVDAMRKGDVARFNARVYSRLKVGNSQDIQKVWSYALKAMGNHVTVLKVDEKDGDAALWLSGTNDGKPSKGRGIMRLEEGKWVMVRNDWP